MSKRVFVVLGLALVLVLASASSAMAFSGLATSALCGLNGCHSHPGFVNFSAWHASHSSAPLSIPCDICHPTNHTQGGPPSAPDGTYPLLVCDQCHLAATTTAPAHTAAGITSCVGCHPAVGALSGTVSGAGAPLAGVSVTVAGMSEVLTFADGSYWVPGIAQGTYAVTYARPGFTSQTLAGIGVTIGGVTSQDVTLADTTPPTTTSDVLAIYASDAHVQLTAIDAGSGVARTYYKVDSGVFTPASSFTITGDGLHSVSYYSVDRANNIETTHVSGPLRIDTVRPVTTSNITANKTYAGAQTFTLSPTDIEGSGVAATWSQLDSTSGSWTSGTSVTVAPPSSGSASHTLYFYSRDAAGNTENTRSVSFGIQAGASQTRMPVWRFYNTKLAVHLYTADAGEMAQIRDKMSATYHLDGVCYEINTGNPANSVTLWRFFNAKLGVHLYTADVVEKNRILTDSDLKATYRLDGPAYNVSMTTGIPVYRFYDHKKGVHFYTSDPAEMARVRDTMSATYRLEGPAFYIGQ